MEYYQKSQAQIFNQLNSSVKGLSDHEAMMRLHKYGFNLLKEVKKTPLIVKFFLQFKDILAIILIIIGVLALLIGEPRDFLIIITIVLINAIIGFIQEYKAEKILAAFRKHLPSYSKVYREGKLKQILTLELVPGDIIFLEPGDAIGADARIIESFGCKTNDFSLTGEVRPQAKKAYDITEDRSVTDIDNMVFMGTSVIEGETKALVVATGQDTEFGKIAQQSQAIKEDPTPLQKELIHTGRTVAKIATVIAVFVLILLYLFGRDIKESILFAIAAGAAMVPEGLPAAMSVALSIGAQRMLKKKALVKKLLHVESLGSVTTICTDKTGTLTTGQMSLVATYPNLQKDSNVKNLLCENLALCNNASISEKVVGDPLEVTLLQYLQAKKINHNQIKNKYKRVFEVPFSSKRKMMSVVCKNKNDYCVYTKGAPQEVMQLCNLSEEETNKLKNQNDEMAKTGLKVLALAYKKIGQDKDYKNENIEKNLTFLALIGLEDPPRDGVKEAIRLCEKAKIKVIMITGDYGLTALSIADQIGLSKPNTKIITGLDLHKMDDDGLKSELQKDMIFARIDPGQKLRIVKCLQEMKEVVAVTGDGVNDAPALVKADIGVAMGKIGTDVAKEASDMILLDDHFATIVNAIREGRRIFDNAIKFVFYIFSSNAGELIAPLIGVLLGLPLPLIAIQILAIDLGTDVFPSLALGVEKEEPKIMEKPPRSKTERIMSIKMLSRLLSVGVVMGLLALGVYIFTLYQGGWHYGISLSGDDPLYFQATASVYTTLVLCQVANAFTCRSEKLSIFKMGLFSNKWLIYAEIISFFLLYLVVGFPPLQNVFRTALPSPVTWILIFASFFIFLLIFQWKRITSKIPEKKFKSTKVEI